LSGGPSYDEWLASAWNHPEVRRDLTVAVLDGDTVLSFVTTTADPERGMIWSNRVARHRVSAAAWTAEKAL